MGIHMRSPGSKALWVLKVAKVQAMQCVLDVMFNSEGVFNEQPLCQLCQGLTLSS